MIGVATCLAAAQPSPAQLKSRPSISPGHNQARCFLTVGLIRLKMHKVTRTLGHQRRKSIVFFLAKPSQKISHISNCAKVHISNCVVGSSYLLILLFHTTRGRRAVRFDSIRFVSIPSSLYPERVQLTCAHREHKNLWFEPSNLFQGTHHYRTNVVSHVHSGDRRRWLQVLRSPDGDCGVSSDAGLGAHRLLWLWLCCAVELLIKMAHLSTLILSPPSSYTSIFLPPTD